MDHSIIIIVDSIPPPTTGPPITTPSQPSTTTDQTTMTEVTVVTQASTTTAASSTSTRGLGTTGSTPPATDTPPTVPTATSTAMPTITVFPVTSSGDATAGESYSLECTVTVTGSNDQPTITWLMGANNMITSGVVTTGGMSTLTFNPLAASHAGIYTCRATLDSVMDSASTTITVQSE